MAQYFKDLGKNLRSGYHELRKNPALKGMDDYFDRINAGGGEGLADFAVDMSGIADIYQVGKQGAHIADDLFREGKSWDQIDQGRKDALKRGAVGTALTLAPLPGLKAIGAGTKYATKGLSTAGRNLPGKAIAGSGLPKIDKMRRRLEKAHGKAGTTLATGLSDKAIAKTYRKFKDIPNTTGGRAAYAKLGGNADIIAPGIGKTRRAIRALGGVPLTKGWRSKFPQRAAAVALKDWDWGEHPSGLNPFYRGEYAGQGANDISVMEEVMRGAFPGQGYESSTPPPETFEVPEDERAPGQEGEYVTLEDGTRMWQPADPNLPVREHPLRADESSVVTSPSQIAPPGKTPASLKEPSPRSTDPGAPVFDPRTNEFVRAESLTAEEREAFAGATAAAMKNLDPFNRTQTHTNKGDLRGPGSNWRQQLQRQLDQEKSLKKVHEGYRGDRGREGARGSKIYDSSERDPETGELVNMPTPKRLSDMDIHKLVSANKVAESNRTDEDILEGLDNPFREFYSDDYRSQLEREARPDEDYREDAELAGEVPRHELENPAPDTSPIERLEDRQSEFDPEMPPLSEPRPIPDSGMSGLESLAPELAREYARRDAGPEAAQEAQQSLQNLDLSPEIDAGQDLIPELDRLLNDPSFSPTPSTNGTSTTIRDLNEPAGAPDTSVGDQEMLSIWDELQDELDEYNTPRTVENVQDSSNLFSPSGNPIEQVPDDWDPLGSPALSTNFEEDEFDSASLEARNLTELDKMNTLERQQALYDHYLNLGMPQNLARKRVKALQDNMDPWAVGMDSPKRQRALYEELLSKGVPQNEARRQVRELQEQAPPKALGYYD
jgi:hypothetical protein